MSRRRRLRVPVTLAVLVIVVAVAAVATPDGATSSAAKRSPSIEELLDQARRQGWDTLAIGERVARFGLALEDTPYLGGTLEAPGPEGCRVTTDGFDCVTFMELCLALARVTDEGEASTAEDVRDAVTLTRYRGGALAGYASRLHYTSEWIADGEAKGVIEDVTAALGGTPCAFRVGYMSEHPDRYPALVADSALVDSMRVIEQAVNRMRRACVPKSRVAGIESRLRSGDLVAIATSIDGLDYAHTGMIVRDARGARLLHASSQKGRVVLDGRLSAYLEKAPKSMTGVTIVRPLEVGTRGRR